MKLIQFSLLEMLYFIASIKRRDMLHRLVCSSLQQDNDTPQTHLEDLSFFPHSLLVHLCFQAKHSVTSREALWSRLLKLS